MKTIIFLVVIHKFQTYIVFTYYQVIPTSSSGWWYTYRTYPSEKYESQLGLLFPLPIPTICKVNLDHPISRLGHFSDAWHKNSRRFPWHPGGCHMCGISGFFQEKPMGSLGTRISFPNKNIYQYISYIFKGSYVIEIFKGWNTSSKHQSSEIHLDMDQSPEVPRLPQVPLKLRPATPLTPILSRRHQRRLQILRHRVHLWGNFVGFAAVLM